jgi:molecular chaperone GrpE
VEEERTNSVPVDGEGSADQPSEAVTGESRADDLRTQYLYAMAEMENTRKRLQQRADEASQAFKRRLLLKFLPVLDNLERSLSYEDSEELRSGLAATLRGFESALQSEGVTPVETRGKRFDPSVAEAIGTQPAAGVEDETVLDEARRGYRVDEELLRPAQVVVARNQ